MQGDDRVRFCGQCEKNVYNISALTHAEAEDLIREKEGKLCVRFYQRVDGTVLTADCPWGRRRRRRRHVVMIAGTAAGLLITAGFVSFARMGSPSYRTGVLMANPPPPDRVMVGGLPLTEVLGDPVLESPRPRTAKKAPTLSDGLLFPHLRQP
jgi:hypothetical protein